MFKRWQPDELMVNQINRIRAWDVAPRGELGCHCTVTFVHLEGCDESSDDPWFGSWECTCPTFMAGFRTGHEEDCEHIVAVKEAEGAE